MKHKNNKNKLIDLFVFAAAILLAISGIILIHSIDELKNIRVNFIQASHSNVNFTIKADTLTINYVSCFEANGVSMQPEFFDGNTLCFSPPDFKNIKAGQIVMYKSNNHLIAHRIRTVNKEKQTAIIQADNTYITEEINLSQITGILSIIIYN